MDRFNNYVKIDLDAIRANFDNVYQKAGVPVMAVVKADAYGHGAVQVAQLLADRCAFFGVSSLSEALELRLAKIENPILILGHTPVSAFPEAIANGIRIAIFTWEDALALSQEAQKQNKTAPFHFAVDTGMSRLGFQATEESANLCAQIAKLPGLEAEGLFSHFATADCEDLSRTKAQADLFDRFCQMLEQRNVNIKIRHLDNSAGIMNFGAHYDMVRCGIVTYGLYPSEEVDPTLLPLQPAMSWHSHVAHVKWLEAGRQIGYGGAYTTTKSTRVATVPVGYADGYPRCLSNKFYVLIAGQKAPILGRVCMDQLMVDVTDIPNVQTGDEVVLMGKSGEEVITAEAISAEAYSFNYEFVCGISRRVCRCYTVNGKVDHIVNFLLD